MGKQSLLKVSEIVGVATAVVAKGGRWKSFIPFLRKSIVNSKQIKEPDMENETIHVCRLCTRLGTDISAASIYRSSVLWLGRACRIALTWGCQTKLYWSDQMSQIKIYARRLRVWSRKDADQWLAKQNSEVSIWTLFKQRANLSW